MCVHVYSVFCIEFDKRYICDVVAISTDKQTHTATNTFFFSPLKNVALQKPTMTKTIHNNNETIMLTLNSNVVAPYVYLTSGGVLGKFSDNGFTLLPMETKVVEFEVWNSPGTGNGSFADQQTIEKSLEVCSLRDSYI